MAALSVQSIDRFIGSGNPLAKAGGARMLLRATGGNLRGAAMLAALAKKESSFGAAAFVPNNFWGYGIHAGPSVNRAPTVEAMAQRVYKALVSPTGYYKKAKDPIQAISIYAPSSENNTGLYQSQVAQWLTSMGANPKADYRGGPQALDAPPPPGRSTTGTPGAVTSSSVPGGFFGLTPQEGSRFQSLLGSTTAGALQGQMPGPEFASGLGEISSALLGRIKAAQTAAPAAAATPAAPKTPQAPPGPAGMLQPHGDWAGTHGVVQDLYKAYGQGLPIISEKRARRNTTSGNMSDHYQGNSTAYAYDIGTGTSSPTPKADTAASAIVSALSNGKERNWGKHGGVYNITKNGLRYQVLYRTYTGGNHFNHVHLGVRRA